MKKVLKIGDLAELSRCAVETIRYYETEGLLPPAARSAGNYRLYGQGHVDQMRFIRKCRSLDMTLGEIRSLLVFRDAPTRECADVNALLDEHIGHVAERIHELKDLERQLKQLREQCQAVRATAECGILQLLESDGPMIATDNQNHGHLHRTHK